MSVKRKEKQEKRKKKRLKRANNAPTQLRAVGTGRPGDPYGNADAVLEDVDLMQSAWEQHYGELSADFVPPLFEEGAVELKMAPWVGTFRDLMLEKYTDMTTAEPKIKFILSMYTSVQ